jgi:diaminohydroxyphosphoribosylaminopyrimidine deaminase/5-amino-6-(5-phosphoribosylamino)uracil reductase
MSARFDSLADAMRQALVLASRGLGRVEPNPAVGAVIVDEGLRPLGEGWHQQFGGPHAEVHAIAAAGRQARGATLVVTLEPCAHHGKTPPCVDAVLAAGLRRVVIGTRDPALHGAGRGIERLRKAGVEVEVGLLEPECRRLIAPFTTLMTRSRPYVHAKWAMTLDGRIASRTGHSRWISNERSRAIVHELRGRMDAILVGVGTVLADDPQLTARPPGPRTAVRIVLDSRGRTPLDCRLTRDTDRWPTLIATTEAAPVDWQASLRRRGVEVFVTPHRTAGERVDLPALLLELGRRGMTNLLVEGGSEVLGAFFDADLVEECHVFIAPKLVGGREALAVMGGRGLEEIPGPLHQPEYRVVDGDLYVHGWRNPP